MKKESDKYEGGLMELKSIRSMCVLENKLINKGYGHFGKYCDKKISKFKTNSKKDSEENCCASLNLGNYIASMSGRKTCLEVSQSDVNRFTELLRYCGGDGGCSENETCGTLRCNASVKVLDVLESVRANIMNKGYGEGQTLKYVMSHLPLSRGRASRDFYESIKGEEMVEGGVKLVAIDVDLKEELFDEYLRRDLFRSVPSVICIVVILIFYTGSPLITTFTLLNIFISLTISIFVYRFIFHITFFPFLNLLAIIILYATGVDAIFVSIHILSLHNHSLSSNQLFTLQDLFKERLTRAFAGFAASSAATFVTYISAAFSHVVILRCFAIFASLSVVVHFVVSIFFIPSAIVLNHKISLNLFSDLYKVVPCMRNITNYMHLRLTSALIFIVRKFRILLVISFSLFTLILIFLFGFYFHKFLPSIKDHNLLASWHHFELFDSITRDYFVSDNSLDGGRNNLSMRFIWGIKPLETSEYFIPDIEGDFELESLDLSSKQSQVYLLEFCRLVRSSAYYTREVGFNKNNCFMDEYRSLMQRGCRDIDGNSLKPCCSLSHFPYKKRLFKKCLKQFLPTLARNTLVYSNRKTAGLRFNSNFTQVTALVVEFVSNVAYDAGYEELKEFYSYMRNFTDVNIQMTAPEALKEGWFSSELEWFDLQRSLFRDMMASLLFSLCGLCLICLFCSGFSLLSTFTILTITLSTTTSFTTLLLSGWTFNVFETMAFFLVVGLSIDFSLHNAAVFKHAHHSTSQLQQVASMNASVFLAGLTTVMVGVCYHGSVVMPYTQLATLLITVVSFSWLYSTFFFLPLLSTLEDK